MDQEKVGKLIKKIRQDAQLTQEKFALKYGVTYQAVSKWETGKSLPDIGILKKICDDFNYDINDFLNGNESNVQKNNNKFYFIGVGVLSIIVVGFILLILNFSSGEDFDFKALSTTCENFKLFGSMAYNDKKTSIYISNITYCGEEKKNEYRRIECVLYEKNDNVKTKISEYIYDDEKMTTLDNFLKDIEFNIDNYAKTCKTFRDNGLVLEIIALVNDEKVEYYEIPLKFEDNCN